MRCPNSPPFPFHLTLWSGLARLLAIGAIVGLVSPVEAQFWETFDGPETSWSVLESDCPLDANQWAHRRKTERTGQNQFEQFFFETGQGTQLLVAHPIEPAFVIPELTVELRVRSADVGLRLMVRIVLPHTRDVDSQNPITTYLLGPEYRRADHWQTLRFPPDEMRRLLQQQLWILRRKFGPQVNLRNAYVDRVVVNLYTEPGPHRVDLDDLKVDSIVSAQAIARQVEAGAPVFPEPDPRRDDRVQPASATADPDKLPSLVRRDGSVILVRDKPFFPRIIQHNGEPFAFLKSLGFNTVQLRGPATPEQLNEAKRLDIWLICPPPSSTGIQTIPFAYDRVLAWSIGERQTARNLVNIQNTIREIRDSDLREGRPIVAHVRSHWSLLGRELDVTLLGQSPLGSSFLASQYNHWIEDRAAAIGNRVVWADIQTECSRTLLDQARLLTNQLPPTPIEPQQIHFLIYEAIAGGARGLRFTSRTRLDLGDPAARLRATTLSYLLDELEQLAPWVAGGAVRGTIETGDDRLEVTAIDTSRARLLLVQRPTHREQYWAGDVPLARIRILDSTASYTDRAYQITPAGMIPLDSQRDPAGLKLTIDPCPYCTAIALTQDPLVTNRLNALSTAPSNRPTALQRYADLARQWLAIMQLIESQCGQWGHASPAASGALNEAVNALRQTDRLQTSGSDQLTLKYLHRAHERLAFVRRELMSEAIGNFASKTSTPLLTHISLVPLHWQLADRLRSATWKPNALAGGDFEDLPHMLRAGWTNHRVDITGIATQVELTRESAREGTYGLQLSVSVDPGIKLVETTPVWITSAPVPVKAGQLVRIHGWARVPRVISRSQDGLVIRDSLSGHAMAERIPFTDDWQEFSLYRAVLRDGKIDVTFEMTGAGTAWIDEVTVRTIDLPRSAERQARKLAPGGPTQ